MSRVLPDVLLDVRDLSSPLPLLKTRKAIYGMSEGQLLEICVLNGSPKADILYLLQRLKLELLGLSEEGGAVKIMIRKQQTDDPEPVLTPRDSP